MFNCFRKLFPRKKKSSKKQPGKDDDSTTTNSNMFDNELIGFEELLRKKVDALQEQIYEQNCLLLQKHGGLQNKFSARRALNKKKKLSAELKKIQKMLVDIELQREQLQDGDGVNTEVLNTLFGAAQVLKKEQEQFNADQVHELMDSLLDQCEVGRIVLDEISSPIDDDTGTTSELLEKEALKSFEQDHDPADSISADDGDSIDASVNPKFYSASSTPPTPSKDSKVATEKEELTEEQGLPAIYLQRWRAQQDLGQSESD